MRIQAPTNVALAARADVWALGPVAAAVLWGASAMAAAPQVGATEAGRTSEQPQTTRRMAERLARLADAADPTENLYLNAQRAELTERELSQINEPQMRSRGLFLLAPELLLSGRTEAAIDALKELRRNLTNKEGDMDDGALKLVAEIDEMLGVAYLRMGEQQNCLANHTVDSCLLPIRRGGVHQKQEGSRMAIEQFTSILRQQPDNVTAKWLLNLAYMTLGEYPDAVPREYRVPETRFKPEAELDRFVDRAHELGVAIEGLAGGVVVEDLDGDGDLDLMCSSWGLRDQLRLFRNDDGHFIDWTEGAGLLGIVGGLNLVHADYDNDGRPDVLVLRGGWWGEQGLHPNSLLRNESGRDTPRRELRFRDVTVESGLLSFHPTQTAAWADYDLDGWLDLFVGNESVDGHPHPAELFRNNGDGTFSERATELGLEVVDFVKGVTWGDYNNDGFPDLYVSSLGSPNRLFRNDGPSSGGSEDGEPSFRFTEVAREAGVAEPIVSFPTWFFDYDNDGWLDIFVSGYAAARGEFGVDYMELVKKGESPRLYRNRGDGTFSDETASLGLDELVLTMGSGYGDLDNDGFLDFYLGTGEPDLRALTPNRMYRNERGRRFLDVTFSGGFGHLQKGHGVAFADFDLDGDQDVYAVMGGAYSGDRARNVLFENPGNENQWISVALVGTKTNRSAIGARLHLRVRTSEGLQDIYRSVGTGGSFGSTSLRQHIGLSDAASVQSLEVHWPGSERQTFEDLPIASVVTIREGGSRPEIVTRRPLSLTGAQQR